MRRVSYLDVLRRSVLILFGSCIILAFVPLAVSVIGVHARNFGIAQFQENKERETTLLDVSVQLAPLKMHFGRTSLFFGRTMMYHMKFKRG